MRTDAKQAARIREALAGAAAKERTPIPVPWAPTAHKPEKPLTHHRQAPPPRDSKGRFTGK